MLYLKKYFTEGLIQVAILLSLCGVRVDVGLEPYLPPSWQEMIRGPTSALTQTQFHNFRNSLEDGHGLHPKSVDLDSFFTARRLLGWVNSLDRLQVPHAELETWLVQREPDPLSMGCPDHASPLERAPSGDDRDQIGSRVEARGGPGTLQAQQLSDRRRDLEPHPTAREHQLSPAIPTDNNSLDLELHWQDLFAIMEPENKDCDMMSLFDHTQDPHSRPSETLQGVGSEALHHSCKHDNAEAYQEVHLMETPVHRGCLRQSEEDQVMLPLAPSSELDDHSSAFSNSNVNNLQSPPDHMDLLSEDSSVALNAEENLSGFNMNMLMPNIVHKMECSRGLQCAPYLENNAGFDINFHPCEEGNGMTQDSQTPPSGVFLDEKVESFEDEDELHSPLSDLLEDVALLDDVRLLDLALDECFSPEMAASLEEEVYLDHKGAKQKTDDHSVSSMAVDQSQPKRHDQDGEDEAASDSGLSLDFSYTPASPCASEASYYSSSSSLSESSSSSVGSPFSKDWDDDAEDELDGSDMEVTIKQETEEEEEMGAVGGWYPECVKTVFPANCVDQKLLNGFSWQGHIDHDHTYNQPLPSSSSPPCVGKMPSKSSPQRCNIKPYNYHSSRQISKIDVFSQDEWQAQTMKIPFSNELIVNLPVEEFNNLMTNYKLNEDQVALIRDIRRRGKNKIAAQNCRKRKLDVVLGLEDEVSCLRHRRSWLLREKQKTLKKLQEMKRQLGILYQNVSSRLRDENGRPLDNSEYLLQFGPRASVTVASHQQEAMLPTRGEKTIKKKRDKKK